MCAQRKKGGQPGNKNALKHGFYADHFSLDEIGELGSALESGLESELNMLRVMAKRLFQHVTESGDKLALDELIGVTSALGATSTRIAGLLRVDKLLHGSEESEVVGAISQALSDVRKELGIR